MFGVFHRIQKRLALEDVDVHVVRIAAKIAVEQTGQVIDPVVRGLAQSFRYDGEGIRNTVLCGVIRQFGDGDQRSQRALFIAAMHRVCARCKRLAGLAAIGGAARLLAVNDV